MKISLKILVFATVNTAIVASGATVQTNQVEPPELVTARAEYLRAINVASVPPLTAYLKKLESWRQFFTQHGNTAGASAVAAEIDKIKADLADAQSAANPMAVSANQLVIEHAEYGDFAQKKTMDVTKFFVDAHSGKKETLSLFGHDMLGATDPAPGRAKSFKITYTLNGVRKERTFKEGPSEVLNFKKELR
jgi:hypothetical protein